MQTSGKRLSDLLVPVSVVLAFALQQEEGLESLLVAPSLLFGPPALLKLILWQPALGLHGVQKDLSISVTK